MTHVRTQIIVIEPSDTEFPYGLEWGDMMMADNLWRRTDDNYYICLKCRSGRFKKDDILDTMHFARELVEIVLEGNRP